MKITTKVNGTVKCNPRSREEKFCPNFKNNETDLGSQSLQRNCGPLDILSLVLSHFGKPGSVVECPGRHIKCMYCVTRHWCGPYAGKLGQYNIIKKVRFIGIIRVNKKNLH